MVLVSLLVYVVVFILSELLRPKPDVEDARKSSLGDFSFPTATEDRKVPLVWGTVKLSGPNVVWYGDLKQKAITEKVGGGLFTSGEKVVTGYQYFVGIQFGLCRGSDEVVSLERVWNAEEVVYDGGTVTPGDSGSTVDIQAQGLYGGLKFGSGGLVGDLTFFGGSETQVASTYLETQYDEGGDTPAYRGMCYAVWERGYVGTSTSIRPWEFEVSRFPTGLSTTNHKVNSNKDANPAHVLYELLTNSEWGLDQPPADIDTTNFQDVANTLATEGNGFSFQLESETHAAGLLEEIERQIAGKVYVDPSTGLWKIKLARADYTLGTLPLMDESNIISVESFSRGAWDDTTNDIKVKFADRALDYKGTFAQAQDLGNQNIQGAIITGTPQFPGCKNAALANNLAWRELRVLTRPLAKATVVVDRTFWSLVPLDVVRWTDAQYGFTDLAMRVTKIDQGSLSDSTITLDLVEDIFAFAQPSFGNPFGTGWTPPEDTVVAVPANEQVCIDAPRGFLQRDPLLVGSEPVEAKVWVGFRSQVGEPGAEIRESNAEFVPNSTFGPGGFVNATFEIGTLAADLGFAGAPATFDVTPATGTLQQDVLDGMVANASQPEMGNELINLIYCEGEFMLAQVVGTNGGDIQLSQVVRGVLDSTPRPHSSGTRVYFICIGGALADPTFPTSWTVDVKLLPESPIGDTLAQGAATTIQVDLEDRLKRPYPGSQLRINGLTAFSDVTYNLDVQQGGGTQDTKGLNASFIRRDFRTSNELTSHGIYDGETVPSDFPSNNSTEYEIVVRNDPDGANTLLLTIAYGTATNDQDISRTAILKALDGVIPSRLRINVNTRHTYLQDGQQYTSREPLRLDFDVESTQLDGLQNLTVLDTNEVSPIVVAPSSGNYTVQIATDLLTTGDLEYRINGGSWTTLIAAAGGTSGTIVGLTASDDIEFRHTQTGSGTTETLMLVTDDTAASDIAYAILDI